MAQSCSYNEGSEILVFHPTIEEFKDFSTYISYIESKGAHRGGIAKIIPPKEWKATRRYNMKTIGEMEIKSPVSQTITGQQGSFQLFNISKKTLKVKEFKEKAESDQYKPPEGDPESLERKYWRNITFNPPMYAADVPGSIYDDNQNYWNINRLGTILDVLNNDCNIKILGVNTAYLYFGMWRATFPWHTEDMDLYSINYLHFGAAKFWYSIPPEHGKRLETLAKGFFPGSAQECSEFMRHKMTLISPQVLKKFSIPVNKVVQNEGEFIITFPYGYHCGFNQGFNCAESTNFASERWIDFGRKAKHCQCKRDSVKIDMDVFIKKFQPEEWKKICLEKKAIKEKRKGIKKSKTNNKGDIIKKAKLSEPSKKTSKSKTQTQVKKSKTNEEVFTQTTKKLDKELLETLSNDESSQAASSTNEDTTEESTGDESSINESPVRSSLFKASGFRKLAIPKKRISQLNKVELKKKKPPQIQKSKRHPIHSMSLDEESSSGSSDTDSSTSEEEETEVETEDESSDEDNKSLALIQEETILQDVQDGDTMNIEPIYSCRKYNEEKIKLFNKKLSATQAQCAVCVYFSAHDAGMVDNTETIQNHSNRLVSELCFAKSNSTREESTEVAFNLMFGQENEREDKLYRCRTCSLLVHDSCYGVSQSSKHLGNQSTLWSCDKCRYLQTIPSEKYKKIARATKCCLCTIRGGALKRTTDNRWCHIVCAIAIPDVCFVDQVKRGPIDLSKLPLARRNLGCTYCKKVINKKSGACVQCISGKCATPFHATCSFHNGIPLFLGDWPVLIETFCKNHIKQKLHNKGDKRELSMVNIGDSVIAKHKNTRYYKGIVLEVNKKLFYKVVFEDKSFCFDLPPEDIQSHNANNQIVVEGEIVKVLWPDGLLYNAQVNGHWYDYVCQVRFEDGSIRPVKRVDVYLENETLPKRIQSKISYASVTANKFYHTENHVGKRSRSSSTSNTTADSNNVDVTS